MDPEKSNRALGFLALITSLCQFYGVAVVEAMPSKVILMMQKNQELSKVSSKDSRIKFQDSRFKNQVAKIKIQDSRFKNQEKPQSR